LFKNLHGLAAADKGYLSKKKEESLFQKGVKLITKVRRNMKGATVKSCVWSKKIRQLSPHPLNHFA
ncbi:transposase, partial [Legionella pneumophila serogroup 2]